MVSVADRHDPVPRARRRQPRADGLEHAAPVGAAAPLRGAVRRHRHGVPRGRRLRRRHHRRQGRCGPGALRRPDHDHERRRHLLDVPAGEVPPVEPGHVVQPEADRRRGRPRRGRPGHRRRSVHRPRRDGARAQPARGVHVLGGPQLRGRDHPSASAWCRTTSSPRSTSRSTRSTPATPSSAPRRSPGTSRTSPRRSSPTSTSAASSGSAPTSSPATSWSARSRPRARPSSPRRSACSARSSARRRARCATPR